MCRLWTSAAACTVFLALLVAAACGGDDEAPPETTTPAAETPRPAPSTIDLATTAADLTVFGGDADDYLADRFSLAQGDFNGDGIDDILVGAPKADGPDNGRTNAGEAYVILGSADVRSTLDIAEGQQDLTVIGASKGDNLGFVVASGDVNGDGIDDVLLGARFAGGPDGSRPYAGEAYVVFGSPDLSGTVDTAVGEQDFTVLGARESDYLGYALAAGDVNGDGIDDVIVAAPGADRATDTRTDGGEAYVVFGSPALSGTVDIALNEQDFTILGAAAEDFLANFAASGDVNDDGVDDVLLGTHMSDGPDGQRADAGAAYVIFG